MTPLASWARGYCAARGYGPPVPALNGRSLWFAVGKPDQVGRYVLVDQGLEALAQLREPHVYVEIAGPRSALAREIPDGWQIRSPAFLMVAGDGPREARRAPPDGIAIERTAGERSIEVLARASDHRLAARGVVGIDGDVAVFDQIVTEPEFRRRGLGSVVMHELADAAATAGATRRILIATEDGRALYTRLGWTVVTDVVSLISPSTR